MFVRLLRPFIFVLALALLSSFASAQSNELRGRVVSDGDIITVLDSSNTQHKIRRNGVDAPESKQDFGQVSKRNLSDLVFGKDVIVRWSKGDKYGRIIGTVMIGNTNANLEQLRAGLAWYYKDYERDVPPENRRSYAQAEDEARAVRRGLWQQPNPQPPWEFRHAGETPFPSTGSGMSATGRIIGNRNSQIYNLSNCPDYSKSAEKNRVYFDSEAEAQRAGFRKARNCP